MTREMQLRIEDTLMVATGGAIGAWLRVYMDNFYDPSWYSFFVNLLGCFLMGALTSAQAHGCLDARIYRYFLKVGLIGSFTTIAVICWCLEHQNLPALVLMGELGAIIVFFTLDCALGYWAVSQWLRRHPRT